MYLRARLFLIFTLTSSSLSHYTVWNGTKNEELDWWQKTVIYQIYPLSFKDSDGDGYGDIKGINQTIEYLKILGVDAVRISSVYRSPMKDFGYDISNYTDVDPIFGNLEDFKSLVKKIKDLGMKLIMDFVPNHTSDEHIWFQKSVQGDPQYKDYYVWADPKFDVSSQTRLPPSNWTSVYGGSAWEYNSMREQYYLHQFSKAQPDLNFRNKNVTRELTDVLKFWLDLGADGYSMNAVDLLYEKEGFPDEPVKVGSGINDSNNYGYLDHIYTTNQPETFHLLAYFRQQLDKYSSNKDNITRVMITESYTSTYNTMKQYGNKTDPIAHFPLNFELLNNLGMMAENFDIAINDWMDRLPSGAWPNWVLGNHDNRRVGDRCDPKLIDELNMILLLLPGTAVTYYGEEIGMLDNMQITYNESRDPLAVHAGSNHYMEVSRDPERTPFQWNDKDFSGFTKGGKPWLPVNSNYDRLNLMDQKSVPKSHYNIYRKLVKLRNLPAVQMGELEISSIGTRVLAFKRFHEGDKTGVVVVVNFGEDMLEGINIGYVLDLYETKLEVNITTPIATYKPGEKVGSENIQLNPFEGLVFTYQNSLASPRSMVSITMMFLIPMLLRIL